MSFAKPKVFFDFEEPQRLDTLFTSNTDTDDDSSSIESIQKKNRITRNILTKYEKTVVIGARAALLAQGAQIMQNVDVDGEIEPAKIAEFELRAKALPIKIRRYLPNGTYEDWDIKELEI